MIFLKVLSFHLFNFSRPWDFLIFLMTGWVRFPRTYANPRLLTDDTPSRLEHLHERLDDNILVVFCHLSWRLVLLLIAGKLLYLATDRDKYLGLFAVADNVLDVLLFLVLHRVEGLCWRWILLLCSKGLMLLMIILFEGLLLLRWVHHHLIKAQISLFLFFTDF